MGWRKILGEFKGESPLKKKKGQCLKAFTVQEWCHLGAGVYSNSKIQIAVRLAICLCSLWLKLFLVWHFFCRNNWCLAKIWTFSLRVWGQKYSTALFIFTFSYLFTYNLIWRGCTGYVAFHLSSLPPHCVLDWFAGDDGRSCIGQKNERICECM